MTIDISTTADHDAAIAEKGVHHEQPSGTDWAAADVVEKGYPSSDEGGSSLVAYYPFDEDSGTTANDVAGAHDGTISGATVGQPGILGTTCYSLDGTDDYVDLPNDAALQLGTTFSFAAWVKTSTTSPGSVIRNDGGSGQDNAALVVDWDSLDGSYSDKAVAGVFDSGGGGWTSVASSTSVNDGNWHLLGLTYDGTDVSIWVDGVNEGSATEGQTDIQHADWDVGRQRNDVEYLAGDIDELRIYGRALDAGEITALYEAAL